MSSKSLESMSKSFIKLTSLSKRAVLDILSTYENFLFDCDGVLWHNHSVVPVVPTVLKKLKELGKRIFYVTNKSSQTRESLSKKATRLDYVSRPEDFISTPYLIGTWLKSQKINRKLYIIGSPGLAAELKNFGFECIGIGPELYNKDHLTSYVDSIELDQDVGVVVVGFDPHFSLGKMIKASSYILKRQCLFVGTNIDMRHPWGGLLSIPGSGALIRSIEVSSGKPPVILGKPSTAMFDYLREKHGLKPERSIMIGDTCETDIAFAKNCKMKSILVLTGNSSLKNVADHVNNNQLQFVPDYYLDSMADLITFLD